MRRRSDPSTTARPAPDQRADERRRGLPRELRPGEPELSGDFARLVGEVEEDVFKRDPRGEDGVGGAAVEDL